MGGVGGGEEGGRTRDGEKGHSYVGPLYEFFSSVWSEVRRGRNSLPDRWM